MATGKTPLRILSIIAGVRRQTVEVLNVNDPFRVELREELMEEGLFPPA
jgi:hypothetical protein